MSAALAIAGIVVAALVAYAVLAGADFGGGVWDLFASGPRRTEQRAAIAHAIAPVWEANHVWLIFVIVLLFTAFPPAFYALIVGLFVPFHLVLVGVILRGGAFVFRAYGPSAGLGARRWGALFGAASTITPVLLGMCMGAISAGGLRVVHGEVVLVQAHPWLAPMCIVMGGFALATCAYLAAVYLTNETNGALQEDFRARALAAGTVVVALSIVALPLMYRHAPFLWRGFTAGRAVPIVASGIVAALLSGWALRARRYRLARIAAAAHVALLLIGWAVAQYPYLVYPDVTIAAAASAPATLQFVLISLPIGAALLGPSLWFLFRVFKSQRGSAAAEGDGH